MELIRFLLSRSRSILLWAVLFGLVSGATNAGMLAVINAALFRPGTTASTLLKTFIILCAVAPATRIASELLLMRLGQNAVFSLRTDLARQTLNVSLRRLEEAGTHRILSILTDDIPNLTTMVSTVPILFINVGVVVSCLIYMGYLNWQLLTTVILFVALGVFSYRVITSRAGLHIRRARQHENQLQKHFQGLMSGLKELKLHRMRRQAFLTSVLRGTAASFRKEASEGLSLYVLAASWGQLLVFLALGLLVFYFRGTTAYTPGIITGFAFALLYMMTPLQAVMNSIPSLVRAKVSIQNLRELGLELAKLSDDQGENSAPMISSPAPLELRDVVYTYRQEDSSEAFVLGPINLTIQPGELLFITGGNGSGKTTLAKLIAGLYSPEQGEIRFAGQAICDSNRDIYRQMFSAIFSDYFLFDSLLGIDTRELDVRAKDLLASLRLDHKVRVTNGVFSTTDLSQGQRKRLALVVSYLEDRPFLFFDEWAADQDPAFKKVFYHEILPGLKQLGKTVIVISHDDRYYSVGDRVIHLESGRIATDVLSYLVH